jgi:plastocyanin
MTRTPRPGSIRAARATSVAVAVAALLVTGAPATSAAALAGARTVSATETEYRIALSSRSLSPGTYTFLVRNAGREAHALTIDGPGVEDRTTGRIRPGASGRLTVTLAPGTYEIYCPVDDHKKEGMATRVTVS